MLNSRIVDGTGGKYQARVTPENQLEVRSHATISDYERQAFPFLNQTEKIRTTKVRQRFDGRFFYNLNPEYWLEAANVNGSRSYLSNENGVRLTIAGAEGDKYYDISKNIFYYNPDTVIHAAGAIAFTLREGVTQFWGLASYQGGKIKDGYLLRARGQEIEFVKISSVGGVPVETVHPRRTWLDPMDGTGPSGISLDFESIQMVKIEHAWYGAGSAFLHFRIGGKAYTADFFQGANQQSKFPIIANPNLSVLYGIEATKDLDSLASIDHYALSVGSDIDEEPGGKPFGVSSGTKSISGGIWSPIFSIRLKTSFYGKPNVYGYLTRLLLSITVRSRDSEIAFVRDAGLTGANFVEIPDIVGNPITDSMVLYDTAATAITRGIPVGLRSLPADSTQEINVLDNLLIAVDSLGQSSSTLTLVGRPEAGGSGTFKAAFSWTEIY